MSVHFFPENPTAGGGTDPGFITLTGDISGSGSGTISAFLPAITTGKTSTKITFNSKGQVTGGTSLTDLDLPAHSHNVTILGDVTGTGTNSSISTTLSTVTTAGSGIKINYDDKGRVLSSGGLTTIDLPLHTHPVTITGDVTGSGTNSNITTALPIITSPGQATKVSYTAKGLVYAGTSLSDTDLPAHNHPVTMTGDVTGAGTNSNIATTLASITTGKTSTKVTFNNKGLILSGTTLSDTDLPVHTHTVTLTGDVTGTGSNSSITTVLPTITSANTATKITYTAKGLVTGGTTLTDTDLPPHTHTVNVTGDISGNGLNSSLSLTLPNITTAGTYTKVGVNAKGQITSGSNLLATDIPSLDWAKITTGKPTTLSGYGITDALTIAGSGLTSTGNTINAVGTAGRIVANIDSIDLATVGTAGTYTKITTDAYGRATSGTTLSASDIPDLDASKIISGTFPDARLEGDYTGIEALTASTFFARNTASWDVAAGRMMAESNPGRLQIVGVPPINGGTRLIELNGAVLNTLNITASGAGKGVYFSSLINNISSYRWLIYATSSSTETGSNEGSDFVINRHSDAGNGLQSAVSIKRSNGVVSIFSTVVSTSTTTGSLVVSGGVGVTGDVFANLFNGNHQLKTFTTATRPTPSSATLGQIWLNTSTGKIEYVATASTIQTITSA